MTLDGAIVGCIAGLYSTYVLRADGPLIWENVPSNPQVIVEASTGTALRGIVNKEEGSVEEGQYHGCAALSNGQAECWQTNATYGNAFGQQGNGTTTALTALYRATPVLTDVNTPLTNVIAIARGEYYTNTSCAVTSDGKLWCWGDLTWVVKKGTATLHTGYAQAITADGLNAFTGVSQVVVGPASTCALVNGAPNTVWCWGYNATGQLGQGDVTARQYPTKVLGLTSPTMLALTAWNTYDATVCALDGSNVRCWGDNIAGAAGINATTNPVQSPTPVVTQNGVVLGGITRLEPGVGTFGVLRDDKTIWTWGYTGAAYQNYASNYGVTNVDALGWAGPGNSNGPRYLTHDDVYHNGMTNVTVDCNSL